MKGTGSLSSKAIDISRNPHLWVITALTILIAISYYADHFDLGWIPFGQRFFPTEYIHDLHRHFLFLIPMLYCAAIFRFRGAVVISLATFCIMLPRGLFISPYPDPISRAVIFMVVASLATILLGLEQKRRHGEKKAHLELMASEACHRELFKCASDAIFIRHLEGNIIEVNQAASALTGYTVDELARMNISEFLTPESFEITMERQKRQLEGEATSQRYELEIIKKDGTRVIIESVTSLITEKEQSIGIQAVTRDITEQKRWRENMLLYISEITRAQEEERRRIARELHDDTAQALATLSLDIEAIARARERLSEGTLEQLEQLRDKIGTIMEGVHRFSHDLRPGVLDQLGLLPALEWLADDVTINHGIDARVEVIGTKRRLSPEGELLLFRIAQEALSNVRKHSQATEAEIRVEFAPEEVRLAVTDNGQGFEIPEMLSDFAGEGKLGILGMHERARLLNGSFSVESEAGKGTTVSVEVVV